ncbi:MAG: thymidine phosphorylase, partial [Candidatus ainarchaeum sp.]|nr:thymidine phosphorylase [Candidatus ainarchaeum sp.]
QVIASVLAKKASVGAKLVIIDLPLGEGAKVNTRKKAEDMGKKFVEVGRRLGMKVKAVITDANEPCGNAFGAALEAKNVLEILEGKYFDKVAEKSCEIAGLLLEMSGKARKGTGKKIAIEALKSGKALKKMQEIIKAQGARILKSSDIPKAQCIFAARAKKHGKIAGLRVRKLIKTARIAGAPADRLSGVLVLVEKNQAVKKGQAIFEIHSENQQKLCLAKKYAMHNDPIEIK